MKQEKESHWGIQMVLRYTPKGSGEPYTLALATAGCC
jgi:hypothetical protein